MNISIFTKISAQVAFIFITIIFASWIPDLFPGFFGDWFCRGYTKDSPFCLYHEVTHEQQWHWGHRHILWVIMGTVLFIIQVVRIIKFIEKTDKT